MKKLFLILSLFITATTWAQNTLIWGQKVQATQSLQLKTKRVTDFSDDSTDASKSPDKLITERAAKAYLNRSYVASSATVKISGEVIYDSLLIFHTTTITGYINGILYTAAPTTITLSAAHSTLQRQDVFYLDTTGHIGVLTGTPGIPAALPTVDPASQLYLTSASILAGATVPGNISNLVIFKENTEWALTGTATGLTGNNLTNSFAGAKSIRLQPITNGQYLELTSATTESSSEFSYLTFRLRLDATLATTTRLVFSFYNGTTLVTRTISLASGTYGYVRTVSGTYMLGAIPMSDFYFSTSAFTKLRIALTGSSTAGIQLDDVQLQRGGITASATGVNSWNGLKGDVLQDFKTINGIPITGTGDIVISGGSSDPLKVNVSDTAAMLFAYKSSIEANTTAIPLKLNISDTAGKWVGWMQINGTEDSLIYWVGSTRTALKLPAGGGGGEPIDSISINAAIYISDTIIFDGTSITNGAGLSTIQKRFSTLVSQKLGSTEYNLGEGGAKMYVEGIGIDHLGRIPYYNSHYRYMILEWGYNDMAVTDTATFATAYLRYLDTAIARGWPTSKILILSPSYADSTLIATATFSNQQNFNICTRSIAERKNTLFLDVWKIMLYNGKELLLIDQIHPSNDGSSVALTNPIVSILKDSVRLQDQAVRVNGLAEFQKIKYRGRDTANSKTIPIGLDSAGNIVRYNSASLITNSFLLATPQSSNIDISGYIGVGSKNFIPGIEKLKVVGVMKADFGRFTSTPPTGLTGPSLELGLYSSRGYIQGFDRTTTSTLDINLQYFGGQVIIGNSGFSGGYEKLYVPDGGKFGFLQVTGSLAPTTGSGIEMAGAVGGAGAYFGCFNRSGGYAVDLSFMPLGGKAFFGGLYADGSNQWQFTGTGHFSTSLKVGTSGTPDGSSVLDMQSTTKGALLPRMTKTQRDAIPSPATGLMVYQTDNTPGLRVYNGTNWMKFTETAD